jgi:DNA ligase-1
MLCGKFNAATQKYLAKFENNVGFISQKKSDGGRVNITVDADGKVTYKSRSGNEVNLFHFFDTDFSRFPNTVFDGELIIRTSTGKPDRKASNGFYTKAVRGTISEEEAIRFNIELWDIIPLDEFNSGTGTVPYEDRLKRIMNIKFSPMVSVLESKKCSTLAECIKFYEKMRAEGEEGSIIKVANAVWQDGRGKNAIKLKAEETADLLCIGTEEGSGKYTGMIGNLVCVTSCRKLSVNPGTGLNDNDRARDPSYFVGNIIEIGYNEVIKSKGKETYSLFLPVYKQVRLDKTVANSLEELK